MVCNGLRALAVLASNDDNAKKEILRLSAPGVVRLAKTSLRDGKVRRKKGCI